MPSVPEDVRSALLPLHVAVNMLGIVAFALAFAAALGYVIQERLLRRKQRGRRVSALAAARRARLVRPEAGARSAFRCSRSGSSPARSGRRAAASALSTGQGFGLLSWACFGSVLLARAAAGWRGRRAAIGTMLGFLCSMAAIGGYLLRGLHGS